MIRKTLALGALAIFVLLVQPQVALAQELSLNLADGQSISARTIQLILLITVLSVAPGLLVMLTCFPFLITVLSILRQAIGLQQAPPNMLMISLAMFLTYFVMEPVFTEAWDTGIAPLIDEELEVVPALERAVEPFRVFMANRLDPDTYYAIADLRPETQGSDPSPESPLSVLIPSFMLSEITRAFEIGFLVFLPFLVIDLVTAAVLMSMGMMMVPPALVSLPFKLAFFVVADGWSLIASALVRSYYPS
ncbi:Flagellar biosynthesis protein FliP [Tritonibacter mobilis]|uniref:flagellar type III secretion system pore protein FliP n=1 Tax=Tritonibacter mobilis TaxID=379347 RepID=UPI000F6CB876|nr:flagellar type III secretion system pore protein FliP [Tritonibacter mobilis]MCZ4267616.1 flagellar type III secretion system pore protein FliP [Rhodobacteraceae bacterium G21628-S1]MEE2810489.1 flagellar type III secretion system pore protein FliP [Pseudomonadota bacterium]NKX28407.1 flagellar type III secretion system pore protein FliP [Rhodobacteraceae bacterium R_SAG6]NKX36659.1 flagellar type III secretion system pore protein FliP [Rhodobacteraceae bacterium R_SAG4]VCU57187.1 Flagellar